MTTKMIVLTVKTLDSQNHSFTVEDDITVEQFKAHIAETVNIPADTQRIIYCGRVLQDSAKLSEYDVNGKVVHLVQRAPPSSTARNNEPTSPQPQRRVLRNFEHGGNGMFLGSMAFPSNFMESQRIVPPPPTHSLAGSRLNVAKRMLRRAEQVICLLENPSARPTEQTPPDEPQDEVTPVIEARVIVPSSNNEPIDEAIVLSAVQNTLLNGASGTVTIGPNASISTPATNLNDEERQASQSSTPLAASSPISVSTENLNSERQSDGPTGSTSGNGLAENASRTSEMAELLTSLTQLQSRFAPFLERYHNFMQEDPVISSEDQRQTQAMLNRVSEVFHYLGHAYHSLSDIIIRIRMPPPRPLLCRPILIQHSAVVQAGIPIQVEAQINLSDRPPSTSSSNTATTTNSSGENNAASTRPSGENDVNASTESGPQLVGIPYIPTVRVQSFPLEIRGISLPQNSGNSSARPQNNNNNTVTPEVANSNGSSNAANTTTAPVSASSGAPGTSFNLNNPNVEFFMEVTPEGITIDSLETTLIGSNQADDLLRGALNGHPPDLIQSIMQMAGHIINRNATVPVETSQPAQSTAVSSSPSAATPSGQNSQARGNTQTNPTTSTHTRSTSRPHVHLHQQAMQGGFDPFLPCNSHHVTRRRFQTTAQSSGTSQDNTTRQERHGANTNTLHNIMNGIINSIRTAYQQRTTPPTTQQATTSSSDATGGSGEGNSTTPPANRTPSAPSLETLFSNFQPINLPEMLRQGPTIAQLLQQLPPDESYIAGENIITDLIMLISQNLTIGDVVTLNNGVLDPLNRMGSDIQNFFVTRLLDGSTSTEAISRGVDRLLTEMQPFLSNFSQMPVNSDIDMVESVQLLFKSRLPNIIRLASDLTNNSTNLRALVDQLIATANELCALALYASENGLQGVERVFERIVTRYMQGIPNDLQEWTLITSRVHLRQFVCNLNVSYSTLEPYIVRKPEVRMSVEEPSLSRENKIESDEAMELEEQEAGGSGSEMSTSPPLKLDDTETLPNLVIAAEPWHGQVPADWVPIIAKDAQRQRRQNSQPPFSDAYLSGMPSKRRKIVHSSKTQGSMSQIISESVRRAITATGLTSAAPLETVAQAAGSSQDIQVAYRNLLKTSVQATVKDNESFTPERFPNASSYFNNQ